MKLVIDTNIILSALIRDSITRKIIMESDLRFYFPKISLSEIDKYRNLVIEKSGLSEGGYQRLFNTIKKYLNVVEPHKFEPYLKEANQLMGHIDNKDVVFLALALSVPNSKVWSDDKHFKQQDQINVYTTNEMIEFLK